MRRHHALQSGGAAVVSFLVLLMCATAYAQRTGETVQSWPIWGFGNVELVLPPDWGGDLDDADPKLPPRVVLKSDADTRLYCTLNPMILPDQEMVPRDNFLDFVKARVKELPERNPPNIVSSIVEVPGIGSPASAVRIGFEKPDADGYKFLTVAYAYTDDQIFEMRIRADQPVSRERDRALAILKTAGMKAPSTQPADLELRAPGKKWSVVVTTPGFSKVEEKSENGFAKLKAAQSRLGMELTIYLEPAQQAGDATVARDFYVNQLKEAMKQRPAPIEGPKVGGNADLALSQHLFPVLRQNHVTAYLVQDGMWVTVHAWKRNFKAADAPILSQILQSVRFEGLDVPASQPAK